MGGAFSYARDYDRAIDNQKDVEWTRTSIRRTIPRYSLWSKGSMVKLWPIYVAIPRKGGSEISSAGLAMYAISKTAKGGQ